MRRIRRVLACGLVALACGSALSAPLSAPPRAPAQQAGYTPPQHNADPPPIGAFERLADQGLSTERGRPAGWALAEHRRLDKALAPLLPQRKGVVDAYVLSVALDSDPVFGREAREAARVLSRRYDAAGRTVTLAGSDGAAPSPLPIGSPPAIEAALARIAELMDPAEDVLVLYTTSHGAPFGIVYSDGDEGYGAISPARLWSMLDDLHLRRRLVILSACFSGVFVPMLASDDSVILTAASATRSSFGCQADSDWTFFGDALVNHGLRKAQPLAVAAREASGLIAAWEGKGKLEPSQPQVAIGSRAGAWLDALDRRAPKAATAPVGTPAVTLLDRM
ncbi:C13 family peptidase [Sphingomonas aracearum]|uniref:Peptidase C13 n=1 Tax=Sphingomonas aracearum TaxID=2283317 RepID=A0A369VWV4_9SPHN|nr:C13 family peptidase [Sphingomonas aracearum]RDE06864.1 peptidase C13 [Sphingomonas aracearum]